jgi:hypothetical protein
MVQNDHTGSFSCQPRNYNSDYQKINRILTGSLGFTMEGSGFGGTPPNPGAHRGNSHTLGASQGVMNRFFILLLFIN